MTPEVTLIPGLGCATWREYTQRRIVHVNAPVHNGVIMLDGRKPYDVYIGRHVDRNGQYFEASIWGNHKRLPLDEYEKYVRNNRCLMAMLPTLRGKVLGCWHWPNELDECHGSVLLKLLDEIGDRKFVDRKEEGTDGGPVTFVEGWYTPEETQSLFDACACLDFHRQKTPWGLDKRYSVIAFADLGTKAYNAEVRPLEDAPTAIKKLRAKLSAQEGVDINWLAVVRYVGGEDYMNWHQHREDKDHDDQRVWIVSTGGVRPFAIKPVNGGPVTRYMAMPGSLIVLSSEANETHLHAVPRVKGLTGTRYAVNCKAIPVEEK